jgi:hypothetical protein
MRLLAEGSSGNRSWVAAKARENAAELLLSAPLHSVGCAWGRSLLDGPSRVLISNRKELACGGFGQARSDGEFPCPAAQGLRWGAGFAEVTCVLSLPLGGQVP